MFNSILYSSVNLGQLWQVTTQTDMDNKIRISTVGSNKKDCIELVTIPYPQIKNALWLLYNPIFIALL